jgi:hypothetical protein
MTVHEILKRVDPVKPMTAQTLYNYIRKLKIKPLSKVRQHPQQYPANTHSRILKRLGLNGRRNLRRAA